MIRLARTFMKRLLRRQIEKQLLALTERQSHLENEYKLARQRHKSTFTIRAEQAQVVAEIMRLTK